MELDTLLGDAGASDVASPARIRSAVRGLAAELRNVESGQLHDDALRADLLALRRALDGALGDQRGAGG